MTVIETYGLYAVDVGGNVLSGVEEFSVDPGIVRKMIIADGEIYPEWSAIFDQNAIIGFSTTQLSVALAAVGAQGLKLASGATGVFFFKQRDEGGTHKGTLAHQKHTINEGICVPRSLQATHGGDPAILSYEAMATFDGTNNPIVIANSQTLAGTPAVTEGFGPGPVNINGTLVEGVQDINVDFGIELTTRGGDGNAFPSWVSIASINTTARITVLKQSFMATLGIFGVVQGGTPSTFYFRKKLTHSTDVPDGTAEHIKFTMNEGSIEPGRAGVSKNGDATLELLLTPTFDDTNNPFVIATASAIT